MMTIRTIKGLEYGKELYELKLYGLLACSYETRDKGGIRS